MNLSNYKKIVKNHKEEFKLFKDRFFPVVMKWEGGGKLHKVDGDSGGWTIYGIAYNFNKALFNNFTDFKDTTLEEASYIAFVKYYLASNAELVPYDSKLYYFDMAYNMGVSRAIRIMQKCIGVKVDGIIGEITKSKLHLLKEYDMKIERNSFYNRLAENNYKMKKFLRGWLNRSKAIFDFKY